MAIVDELIAILGFDIRGEENAKRFEKRLDSINKKVGKFATGVGKVAGYTAAAGAAAFGILGKSVVQTSATFEGYQAILETIEGSQEKAAASLDFISKFAKTTPFEVANLTDSFVKLKAYGIDPVANDTLRILGDTAAAMGKPMVQAVEAFADASTGEFERLKEFGIKAKTQGDQVTFAWTENGKEVTKTVKKNGEEIRDFLRDTWGGKFAGAMDRQSKTFNGMMSNLADNWTDFKRRIGDAGFFEVVSNSLKGLLDRIQFLDDTGRLDAWAKAISDNLIKAWNVVGMVINRMIAVGGYLHEVYTANESVFYAIAAVFGLLIARAFPLVTLFSLAALALDDFVSFMQGGESVIGDFSQKLQDMLGIGEGLADKIAGWGAAIATALAGVFLIAPGTVLKSFGKLLFLGIIKLAPLLASAIGLLFTPVGWAAIAAAAAAALVYYFWDDIKAGFAAWNEWWRDLGASIAKIDWSGIGSSMMTAIFEGMKAIGGQIREWFMNLIPDWITDRFSHKTEPTRDVTPNATNLSTGDDTVFAQPVATSRTDEQLRKQGGMTQSPSGDQLKKLQEIANRLNSNLASMSSEASVDATLTDARQDNRQFPQTNNVTVNQTVTQPSQAPEGVARATGDAAVGAVSKQRSQLQTEPSF